MKPVIMCLGDPADGFGKLKGVVPKNFEVISLKYDEESIAVRYAEQAVALFCLFPKGGEALKKILENIRTQIRLHPLPVVSFEKPGDRKLVIAGESAGITDWYENIPTTEAEFLKVINQYIDSLAKKNIQDKSRSSFEECLKNGDFEKAEKLLDSLILIDERNREYVLYLGYHYEKNGSLDKAEHIYKRILINAPKFIKGLTALANLYASQGKQELATQYYDSIKENTGDFHAEILSLGSLPEKIASEFPNIFEGNINSSGEEFVVKSYTNRAKTLKKANRADEVVGLYESLKSKSKSKNAIARFGAEVAEIIEEKDPEVAKKIYNDILEYGAWLPEDMKKRMERLGMDPSKLSLSYDFNQKSSKKLKSSSIDYTSSKKKRR